MLRASFETDSSPLLLACALIPLFLLGCSCSALSLNNRLLRCLEHGDDVVGAQLVHVGVGGERHCAALELADELVGHARVFDCGHELCIEVDAVAWDRNDTRCVSR